MENVQSKSTRKKLSIIVFLCCAGYFVSYITRKNLNTAILPITKQTSFTETQLGTVAAALSITYGIGQIISGILADKFKPQNVVFAGLLLASVCNAVFPLFDSIVAFTIIWAINGFGQAMFWPAMVKIIAEYLSPFKYKMACSHISTASQLATVALYPMVSLITAHLSFAWVFYVAAIAGIIMSVVWIIAYNAVIKGCEKYHKEVVADDSATIEGAEPKQKIKLAPIMISCGMITILLGIILQGCLRDGITDWIPNLISSAGNDDTSKVIFQSTLLPLFSIAVTYLGTFVYTKFFKNELKAATLFFIIATVLIGVLFVLNKFSPEDLSIVKIIVAALAVGLMHCINLALISYVPAHFGRYNAVASLSGLTNAFTYVGSAIATQITPIVASSFGWNAAVLLWLGISLCGVLVCALTIRRWGAFIKKEDENL